MNLSQTWSFFLGFKRDLNPEVSVDLLRFNFYCSVVFASYCSWVWRLNEFETIGNTDKVEPQRVFVTSLHQNLNLRKITVAECRFCTHKS